MKELREKNALLTKKNQKLKENLVGKVPTVKLERNFEEDDIIKQLKEDLKLIENENAFIDQRSRHLKEEIAGVQNDLASIQQQLKDIEHRENKLQEEIQNLETEILQKRDKSAARDLMRQKKTAEDLARANEQIKNMIQQKLSDRNDKDRDLQHEQSELEKRKKKLSDREDMVKKLMAERKTTIAQGAFAENQNEITGLILELYKIFKQLKDTTVEEIAKNLQNEKGLLDILNESNEQLLKHKKDAEKLKFNPSDVLYEITEKMIELFQDNLNTRLKMNEYSVVILMQTNEKQNDPNLVEDKKKQEAQKQKARDTRITQLKQKYNLDQTKNAAAAQNANTSGAKLNNSASNNSMQRISMPSKGAQKTLIPNDDSPTNN